MGHDGKSRVNISVSTSLSLEELADLLTEELTEDSLLELISLIEQRSEDDFAERLQVCLEEINQD